MEDGKFNGGDAAFACVDSTYCQTGLSKREYMATHILAGVCANRGDPEYYVERALLFTDELLKQLSTTKK